MATERLSAAPAVYCSPHAAGAAPITPLIASLACLALALLPGVALADSMRCGSRIVKDGDSIEKVLDVCGEPAEQQRTWIQRAPQYEFGSQYYSFPGTEDVPVDLWTYDFGRNKLKQRVRFVDGIVDSIVTLTEKGEQ